MADLLGERLHDPQALLDYSIDWSRWIATDDSITAATWAATPTGLTLSGESHSATLATIWITGGVAGTLYRVTCHITTTDGRQDDRSFALRAMER